MSPIKAPAGLRLIRRSVPIHATLCYNLALPMRTFADMLRWALTLGLWGAVTYLLWGGAWFWAVIWAVPGFYVLLNLVGFATLPIYYLLRRGEVDQFLIDPDLPWKNTREVEQAPDDSEQRRRDST